MNISQRPAAQILLQGANKKPGKSGLKCNLVRLQAILYKRTEYPVGESNDRQNPRELVR